jgi:uroporphyrinogen decarboxylase
VHLFYSEHNKTGVKKREEMILLDSLRKKETARPAVWVMRQAGRYLPEYRELRKDVGSFLDLCYNPEFAKEVTLQPIRRFGMDGAILFSDILVIPQSLGMHLEFIAGQGPKLGLLQSPDEIAPLREKITNIDATLAPIYETVKKVKAELPEGHNLIGFCGAPWTVALYMVDNHPSKQNHISRSWCYQHREEFLNLLDILVEASTHYLEKQIEAGAEAVQIFDSWAGCVPDELFEDVILKPILKICQNIKTTHPNIPIIVFPKGIQERQLEKFVKQNNGLFECIGLDYGIDLKWAAEKLQPHVCIQGNMDPAYLLTTPEIVRKKALELLEIGSKNTGFVFNLGHGITPETPVENMKMLIDTVKGFNQ